jgi:hypothetical protein
MKTRSQTHAQTADAPPEHHHEKFLVHCSRRDRKRTAKLLNQFFTETSGKELYAKCHTSSSLYNFNMTKYIRNYLTEIERNKEQKYYLCLLFICIYDDLNHLLLNKGFLSAFDAFYRAIYYKIIEINENETDTISQYAPELVTLWKEVTQTTIEYLQDIFREGLEPFYSKNPHLFRIETDDMVVRIVDINRNYNIVFPSHTYYVLK